MKKNILEAVVIVAIVSGAYFVGYFLGGYQHGHKTSAVQEWTPKIGDRVQTTYRDGNFGGPAFITTITNVVNVGSRSGTRLLVYGDGLPGVDSWWVKPAP